MTDTHTQEPGRQESEQAYTPQRAVRELTAGCPCDTCWQSADCAATGRECSKFKRWCKTGITIEVKGNDIFQKNRNRNRSPATR